MLDHVKHKTKTERAIKAKTQPEPGGVRFSDTGGPGRGQNGPGFPPVGEGPTPNVGRPTLRSQGRESARELYYLAVTEKTELGNALRRGEVAVQRGIVTREQEPALHGIVTEVLEQLAAE